MGAAAAVLAALLPFAAQAGKASQANAPNHAVYEIAPVPAWVVPREVAPAWNEDLPGSDASAWRNWLIDSQTDLRQGRRQRYFDNAYEAISSEMLSEAGSFEIAFNPEYQKLTIHRIDVRRSGVWASRLKTVDITLARREKGFESNIATGVMSTLLLIPDVRRGDVVRVAYSVEGSNPIMAGLDHYSFQIAGTSPLLDRYIRVLLDADTPAAWRLDGTDEQEIVESVGDGTRVIETHARGLAAITWEDRVPVHHSVFPALIVAEDRQWSDIVDWALELYSLDDLALPADLIESINEWNSLQDRELAIEYATRVVQDEVRYFAAMLGESTHRPSPPMETWQRRYGDCKDKTVLLATVLRRMGFDAFPALVSASQGKALERALPAASAFDHVIVGLRDEQGIRWIDATTQHQRGPLQASSQPDFGFALPVLSGVSELQKFEPPSAPTDRQMVTERYVALKEHDNALQLEVTTSAHGWFAESLRSQLSAQGIKEVERSYTEFYRGRYGAAERTGSLEVIDNQSDGGITLIERYRLDSPWIEAGMHRRWLDVGGEHIANVVQSPQVLERRLPFYLGPPMTLDHRIEIVPPKGWRLEPPRDMALSVDRMFAFTRRYASDTDVHTIESRYENLAFEADPLESGKLLREWRTIREELSARLVFGVPASQSREEQERRLNDLVRGLMNDKPQRGKRSERRR